MKDRGQIRRRRRTMALAPLVVALVVTAGCSSSKKSSAQNATTGTTAGSAGSNITVGLIMSGPSNDNGFYAAGAAGLKRAAQDFGVKTKILESVPPPNGEQAYRDLVAQGANLIIGMGAEFEDGGVAVAPTAPDVKFVVMNGRKTAANLATYQLREAQVASLAAYQLGLTQPAGTTLGLVEGVEIPPHVILRDAVKHTIGLANAADKVVGAFTGDFNDVALAKAAALAQLNNGASVILPWTGAAVEGAFDAVREKKAKAISPLVDRCGKDSIFVASAIADPGGLVYRVVKELTSGTFKPSASTAIGLESPDVVKVVSCSSLASDVQAKVDDMKAKLIAGTVPGLPAGV
jgi:basic membrane protein A